MGYEVREVCLKSEYATRYPTLVAGQWMPAADAGRQLLLWAVSAEAPVRLRGRLLNDDHFLFRGGDGHKRASSARTRASDHDPSSDAAVSGQ